MTRPDDVEALREAAQRLDRLAHVYGKPSASWDKHVREEAAELAELLRAALSCVPADGERPADEGLRFRQAMVLRRMWADARTHVNPFDPAVLDFWLDELAKAASPGSSGDQIEQVVTLLEAAYHPQNPVLDHPADFIRRMVDEGRLPGSSGGGQLTDLNGRELNAASAVLELHLSKVRHPSPQGQDVARVAAVLRRLAGGVEAKGNPSGT